MKYKRFTNRNRRTNTDWTPDPTDRHVSKKHTFSSRPLWLTNLICSLRLIAQYNRFHLMKNHLEGPWIPALRWVREPEWSPPPAARSFPSDRSQHLLQNSNACIKKCPIWKNDNSSVWCLHVLPIYILLLKWYLQYLSKGFEDLHYHFNVLLS